MSHIFDMDNPFFSCINKIIDYVFISFLWIVCSIPIVTIGASTTALYYTTNKVIRNERGEILSEFVRCFRSSFKQATCFWCSLLFLWGIIYIDIKVVVKMLGEGVIRNMYQSLFYGLFILSTFSMLYIFPYIARFMATNKMVVVNSFFFIYRHILKTILVTAIFVGVILLCLLFPICIFFMPCVWAHILSSILERIFERYMSQEELEVEKRRNQCRF